MAKRRSQFGSVRRLPSGRWQARYTAPGGQAVTAPMTFDAKVDAESWLKNVRIDMHRGRWHPGQADPMTFASYADAWVANRLVRGRPLKPRTRAHYLALLERLILPTLGSVRVRDLTPELIRAWYGRLPAAPTQRAHAYALVKAVLSTAVDDDLLAANPCRIRGAGQARRASKTTPLTVDQLEALTAAMPPRYRAMTALAAWCGLRFGELIELRRKDIDSRKGIIHVRRAAVLVDGAYVVGDPKSEAGQRNVTIPPHVLPMVRDHLSSIGVTGRDTLLFPAAGDAEKHMRSGTLAKVFYAARDKIDRPDLRWHDLRHVGASLAADAGASQAELMDRFGWSSPAVAARYVHAAKGRDAEIAMRLSELAQH
jgi:integrase